MLPAGSVAEKPNMNLIWAGIMSKSRAGCVEPIPRLPGNARKNVPVRPLMKSHSVTRPRTDALKGMASPRSTIELQ